MMKEDEIPIIHTLTLYESLLHWFMPPFNTKFFNASLEVNDASYTYTLMCETAGVCLALNCPAGRNGLIPRHPSEYHTACMYTLSRARAHTHALTHSHTLTHSPTRQTRVPGVQSESSEPRGTETVGRSRVLHPESRMVP